MLGEEGLTGPWKEPRIGSTMQGLFHLHNAKDLLEKLRHDFTRLERNSVDAYAAFDFFVTAWHLREWPYPGDDQKWRTRASESQLLPVCEHIAVGAKHFQPDSHRHDSVKATSLQDSAFQPGAFQSDAFQVGRLMVELDSNAAVTLGATTMEVLELARGVLSFWDDLDKELQGAADFL